MTCLSNNFTSLWYHHSYDFDNTIKATLRLSGGLAAAALINTMLCVWMRESKCARCFNPHGWIEVAYLHECMCVRITYACMITCAPLLGHFWVKSLTFINHLTTYSHTFTYILFTYQILQWCRATLLLPTVLPNHIRFIFCIKSNHSCQWYLINWIVIYVICGFELHLPVFRWILLIAKWEMNSVYNCMRNRNDLGSF